MTDTAGNVSLSSNVVTVQIDKTKPTLNPVVSPNPLLLNGAATATSGAADALSGLASQSCGALVLNSAGTKSVTRTATDKAGNTNSADANYVVSGLTALGPANFWVGLKNSDDVGTKFDLLAGVLNSGTVVSSTQLPGIAGGSSGFNNAVLRALTLTLPQPADLGSGGRLSLRLSVRIAVGGAGHRSGTARLWFNDSAANSRFTATIGGAANTYYLVGTSTPATFALNKNAPGTGPRSSVDVFVDQAVGGNPFKAFGTWSIMVH